MTSFKEQDPEKVAEFFDILNSLKDLPSFELTSIVAGQVDGEFISLMIYKKSMTSDFFVEWFKTQLLPALKTPHVIVMDKASFIPRTSWMSFAFKIDTFSYLYRLIHHI